MKSTTRTFSRPIRLWYIAPGDLSKEATAESIHSCEDVRCLYKLGWDITLLTQSNSEYSSNGEYKEIVVCRNSPIFFRFLFEFLLIIRTSFKEARPEFVFFRGPPTLIFFGLTLKLLNIPFGVELNGVFPYRYKEDRWTIEDYFTRLSDNFYMKHAKLIVGVTKQLGELAKKEKGSYTIVSVAPNGVNPQIFSPIPSQSNINIKTKNNITFGFLGTFKKWHGLEIYLQVIAKLNGKGIKAQLMVLGEGFQEKKYSMTVDQLKLKKNISELGINNRVHFFGYISPKDVGLYLGKCDLFLYIERPLLKTFLTGASPLKLWTYLALEKPVLLYDPGVMEDYAKIPGILMLPSDKPDSIADFIIHVWDKYGRDGLENLGRKGRQYVLDNATWEKHAAIISDGIRKATYLK